MCLERIRLWVPQRKEVTNGQTECRFDDTEETENINYDNHSVSVLFSDAAH